MFFVLILILALVFLPTPWAIAVIVIAALIEVTLWLVGHHYSRTRRALVGVQTLVGMIGEAISPLAPKGQVKVEGEIWEAHADGDVRPGETVRVTAVEGLTLEVEKADVAG